MNGGLEGMWLSWQGLPQLAASGPRLQVPVQFRFDVWFSETPFASWEHLTSYSRRRGGDDLRCLTGGICNLHSRKPPRSVGQDLSRSGHWCWIKCREQRASTRVHSGWQQRKGWVSQLETGAGTMKWNVSSLVFSLVPPLNCPSRDATRQIGSLPTAVCLPCLPFSSPM